MRNKFWNRVLVALSGLVIFAAGVLLFLVSFLSLFSISLSLGGTELSQLLNGLAVWQKILLMLGGAAGAALGLHDLSIPFPSRRERGFIMQHTELGDMSISMNALETMVRRCVDQHKELTVKSTRISRVKSGIVVEIRIVLAAGVNIPLTVNALQKQVKQYIMSCSGVEVYEVKVLVETGIPNGRTRHGQELVLEPQPAAQPVKAEAAEEPAEVSEPEPAEEPALEPETTAEEEAPAVTAEESEKDACWEETQEQEEETESQPEETLSASEE